VFVVCTSLGDGTVRVAVTGELTADGAAALRALVAVPPGGARRLELDLTRVTFLDAAGVRAILRLRRTALRAGGRLVLAFRPGEHPLPARFDPTVYRVPTTTEMTTWLDSAGFTNIDVHRRPSPAATVWVTARAPAESRLVSGPRRLV